MTKERTFLVTGATTALGRQVVRCIAPRGRVVTVRASHEPAPATGDPPSCVANLTRADDVRKVIAGFAAEMNVDTIVHLANASTAVSTRLLLDAAARNASIHSFVLRSTAEIYRARSDDPVIVDERHPLDFSMRLTPRQRDWLEADVTASQRIANASMRIVVLRMSEVIAPGVDGGLLDYLRQSIRVRPMGFDPMINVLSIDDAAQALALAADSAPRGIFNVAGADTLPLSELAHRLRRPSWPIPGVAIGSEALRALLHYGRVLDGRATTGAFGYRAAHPIAFDGIHLD